LLQFFFLYETNARDGKHTDILAFVNSEDQKMSLVALWNEPYFFTVWWPILHFMCGYFWTEWIAFLFCTELISVMKFKTTELTKNGVFIHIDTQYHIVVLL